MDDVVSTTPDASRSAGVCSNICSLNKNVHHKRIYDTMQRSICDVEYPKCGSDWSNYLGLNLLHYAVLRSDAGVLLELLRKDADVDVATINGETPLYMAAYADNIELVQMLLDHGAATTSAPCAEESELLGAVRGSSEACARLLLQNGALVNTSCDEWTALHVACFQKNASLMRLLLSYGAEVNTVSEWSYKPLNLLFIEFAPREQFFTWYTDEKIIYACLTVLLAAGDVDVNYASKCTIGNPPALQRALTLLSPDILRLLLNCGANAECLFAPGQRSVHDELVMLSIRKSTIGSGIEDRVLRYSRCLQLLLEHGIEPAGYSLPDAMRLVLHQLRYVPLSRRRPEMEPVFHMLLRVAVQPQTLQSLCRRFMRAWLGHSVVSHVRDLKAADILPAGLAKYLLLFEPWEVTALL